MIDDRPATRVQGDVLAMTPTPTTSAPDRDLRTGRLLPGHHVTRKHGVRSPHVPLAFRRLQQQLVAAQIRDDGGEVSTRRRATIENFARVQRHIEMIDAYLQRAGVVDEAGTLRREALDLLCGFVRTAQLLARVLGLDRRPKDIDTLDAFLAASEVDAHASEDAIDQSTSMRRAHACDDDEATP